MKIPLAFCFALGLAACSSESPPVEDTKSESVAEVAPGAPLVADATPEKDAMPPAKDGMTLPSDKTPPSNPKTPPDQLKSIPVAFQGTWANSMADCAPGMETRLVIKPNELQFLESHGAITRVDAYSPTHIQTFGKFEGEGETWDGKPEFYLVNGKELSMVVDGAPHGKNRVKCP